MTLGYWCMAVLLLSLILLSFGYGFFRALFMAVALLPGMCCASWFLDRFPVDSRHRPAVAVSMGGGIVLMEWLVLFFCDVLARENPDFGTAFPAIFLNPPFILLLLAAFVTPERLLSRWLRERLPRARSLSFISDRQKVTLELDCITYVESNDDEVFVHTSDGGLYRTRTRISQWENLLDERFVRIHRAYLVHAGKVTDFTGRQVTVCGHHLPVSRSHRQAVAAQFPVSPDKGSAVDSMNADRALP